MAYSSLIRARAEALLTGETGTTRTLASGRFTRHADAFRDGADAGTNAAERRFKVRVGQPRDHIEVNTADGIRFEELTLTVQITYALTDAGDDIAEGTGEQDGAGTMEAIEDRATVDANDVFYVLDWHVNWTSLSDSVTVIWCKRDGAAVLDVPDGATVATLSVPFNVLAEVDQTTLAP
jgi:hypothetical protein